MKSEVDSVPEHIDKASSSVESPEDNKLLESVDDAFIARIFRKMDFWLLPFVTMFYFLSFLDRVNLGNARLAGLQPSLGISDHQYSVALTVTYVPYIAAELPSNLLLKAVGPNLMLPTMVVAWGIVTTLQGVVHNYAGLLACRFFLGLAEGGLFPGLVLYLSFFYPRQRLQFRLSLFFMASSLAGAFSGLLAYAIINLDGKGGHPGWAWIFLLEGGFTILFGLISYPFLPSTPNDARFLNKDEKEFLGRYLAMDGAVARSAEEDKFSWKEVGKAFKSVHLNLLLIPSFTSATAVFSLAYFAPSIVQSLGHTATRAQLMSVPPFVVAFFVTIFGSLISDKYRCRGYVSMVAMSISLTGFTVFLTAESPRVRYGSLFLIFPGSYLQAPTVLTWITNNISPYYKRATAIAVSFIFNNSGGILSTWLFSTLSKPPRYTLGARVLVAFSALALVTCAVVRWYLGRENEKKRAWRLGRKREEEERMLGDRSAWFEYAL